MASWLDSLTPLHRAAWQGDRAALADALKRVAVDQPVETSGVPWDKTEARWYGLTALHCAVAGQHPDAVADLLRAGAPFDVGADRLLPSDSAAWTPLDLAFHLPSEAVRAVLLRDAPEALNDAPIFDPINAALRALRRCDWAAVERLVRAGGEVRGQTYLDNRTPMAVALELNAPPSVLEELVVAGASLAGSLPSGLIQGDPRVALAVKGSNERYRRALQKNGGAMDEEARG